MPHFPEEVSPQHSLAIRSATQQAKQEEIENQHATSSSSDRVRIKNRRKRYLDLHPLYFTSSDLELADPLLYDRLVRRHLSAQEREIRGREQQQQRGGGFAGVLEAGLMRGEARLEVLARKREDEERRNERERERVRRQREEVQRTGRLGGDEESEEDEDEEEEDEYEGLDKDAAWRLWKDIMTQRFLAGEDGDFEYGDLVDGNEELDDREEEERVKLEEWLEKEEEEEEEEFLPNGIGERRELKGETGVQDF